MDRGAWRVIVHGVAKSRARLSDEHFHFSFPHLELLRCQCLTQIKVKGCEEDQDQKCGLTLTDRGLRVCEVIQSAWCLETAFLRAYGL